MKGQARQPADSSDRWTLLDEEDTLTERAYRELEELITTLRIPPGKVVSEVSLSRLLGIGRTPIREALQRLARERLVVIMPQRGVMISEINVHTQLRLLEVRREVERLLARLAAMRASKEQRKRFAEIADKIERAGRINDDASFVRLDREFNLLMLDAAGNEFAASAMILMHGLSRRFWYSHYKKVADLPQASRLHVDIARAVAEGEPAKAAAASDRLIKYIEKFTRDTLRAL